MLRKHGGEKKADSRLFRRSHHVDKEPKSHRFAGELFGLDLKEKTINKAKERARNTQSVRPVGVGFGTKDKYGPDESWDSRETIEYKPVPDYYMSQKTF
jgi:hypothetical protein